MELSNKGDNIRLGKGRVMSKHYMYSCTGRQLIITEIFMDEHFRLYFLPDFDCFIYQNNLLHIINFLLSYIFTLIATGVFLRWP